MGKEFKPTTYKGVKEKAKTGEYYITFRDEEGKSKRKLVSECKTAKEAFRVLNETKARISDIKTGIVVVTDTSALCSTFGELAERYYTDEHRLLTKNKTENTHGYNRYKLRVADTLGHMRFPITLMDVERLQAKLLTVISVQTGKKLSPKSVNMITDSMKAIFNWGLKRNKVEGDNPFVGLEKLVVDNRRKRILNEEEIEQLLEAIDNRYYKLMVYIAYYTGARPVSYIGLKLEDIDVVSRDPKSKRYMEPKAIHFSAVKSGSAYEAIVGKKLVRLLWVRLLELADDESVMMGHKYLFPSKRFPRQHVAHATVSDNLQPIFNTLFNGYVKNEEGVLEATHNTPDNPAYKVILYTLRHSGASRIVNLTGNVVFAQKMLNHTSITTTMRYVKEDKTDYAKAMDML